MPNVTYRGPGDSIIFDGLELQRDESVTLGEAEIARLLHAGAELEIDRDAAVAAPVPMAAPRPAIAAESVPAPSIADTVPAIDNDNTPHSAAEEEVD